MKVAVIGGRLQGVEVAYLARKAGWHVTVVDRNPNAPARGLGHQFFHLDVTRTGAMDPLSGKIDLVIPALEDPNALAVLESGCAECGIALAFDLKAFGITSSKKACNDLFAHAGIPHPAPWPLCGFPVVVKPNTESGSRGVQVFKDDLSLKSAYPDDFPPPDQVVQAFLPGPSYSLEVIAENGQGVPLQITALDMDSSYDCKRVRVPAGLPVPLSSEFKRLGVKLASEIRLTGVMDVEVILAERRLFVLEIDARFPSQTPMAVFHSSGVNMVRLLGGLFTHEHLPHSETRAQPSDVLLEHVRLNGDTLYTAGEHIMDVDEPVHLAYDFFGADEAITNYYPGRTSWVATLIFCGNGEETAWEKRCRTLETIGKKSGVHVVPDAARNQRQW